MIKNNNQFIIPLSANGSDLLCYIATEVNSFGTMNITSDWLPPGVAQIIDYGIDGYIYFNITEMEKKKEQSGFTF